MAKPAGIIGATKTIFRTDLKMMKKNQAVQTSKKPTLKINNAIKPQQDLPKNKKSKLGL